ncbi:MAG: HEPN domain-containing protein [Deltaproteobacteria bacterium]|nr:HEPN domain-containing protein [Deltaproteobacteria bacterium]
MNLNALHKYKLWRTIARNDFKAASHLCNGGFYLQSLYYSQQSVE